MKLARTPEDTFSNASTSKAANSEQPLANVSVEIPVSEKEDSAKNIQNELHNINENAVSIPTSGCVSSLLNFEYDIGHYINKNVDNYTKCNLLEQPWQPPKNYSFPFSIHKKNGKDVKRHLGRQHLEKHHWLVLSDFQKGLFCKYCALFCNEKCGHNKGPPVQRFVSLPVTTFAKLLGKDGYLQTHENTSYHKECVQAGKDFLRSYHAPQEDVINKISKQRLQQVEENRERLRPIVEAIIFLGRQNIPFRGHRDDGYFDEEGGPENEGNFRELLRLKIASGDIKLQAHLASSSSRATYIGKNTQNALISCCGDEIMNTILENVRNQKYYSVIFDETTDVSHTEQLSLSLRYEINGSIREDFIRFINVYEKAKEINQDASAIKEQRLTGIVLGKIVLKMLLELSLDITYCVGIGTDSCSIMSSEIVGAVTEMKKSALHACRCPCYNHALNNSLSKSSNVVCIRNTIGIMKSVISFFNMSAKRNMVLKQAVGHQLINLCETRWVERHDSIIQFRVDFIQIVEALTLISMWLDTQTSSKATSILNSLCSSEFLISMMCLVDILQVTLPLSRLLQEPTLDSNRASVAVSNTISTLEKRRKECNEKFRHIYEEATELASKIDVEIKMPRLTIKQTRRANHPANTVEEYFKRSIYIPLLDHIYQDLISRFDTNSLECFGLRVLIPTILVNSDEEKLKKLKNRLFKTLDSFSEIIESGNTQMNLILLEGEFSIWKTKWVSAKKNNVTLPKKALETLESCESDVFPVIHSLLKILATLPVSVATAERSFSTLRRVKSWMRSRMTEERLTGLCLLHAHRDISIDIDKVIQRFAQSKNRRLDFVI